MTASRRVIRLTDDASGESHFDDSDVPLELKIFAPPAPAVLVSSTTDASGYVVMRLPTGWTGERHPSPRRQIFFCLSGMLKVTASDGTSWMIEPGTAWFMSDTRGKGHTTDVVSTGPVDGVIIFLNDGLVGTTQP